jgi:hypothetical protein
MVNQVDIARALRLDVSTVNKILNRKPGTKFRPETVQKVMELAKRRGYDFARLKFSHRRLDDRRPTDLRARLTVCLKDGTMYDRGESRLMDLSAGGARLTDLVLTRGALPVRPFHIFLDFDGCQLKSRPVRIIQNGKFDLAVSFESLDSAARKRLRKLL